MDYFSYHDHILCAALLCLAAEIQNKWPGHPYSSRVRPGRPADCVVHDASESVAQRKSAPFLGDLPQYSLRPAGPSGDCVVLPKCKELRRSGVSLDVADHCAELWLLYSGGAVGGRRSSHWNADDSENLCLCVDGADWIFCHETGM